MNGEILQESQTVVINEQNSMTISTDKTYTALLLENTTRITKLLDGQQL